MTSGINISDEFLKLQWDNLLIKEAIFLASPEFYHQLDVIIKNEDRDIIKWRKIRQTFIKYLIRMSTRSTPFGLFAGCAVGEFEKSSCIELAKIMEGDRVTHLDMHFLVRFVDELKKKPKIKSRLIYKPNSSLYRIGDWYRYIEYSYENDKRIHTLESVRHSKYLESLIHTSKLGKSHKQLVSKLREMKISEIEAKSFVNEMIEHQLLISNLEVRVSGNNYLDDLINELQAIEAPTDDIHLLNYFKEFLARIDTKIGQSKTMYQEFTNIISAKGIPYDKKYLFQTDYYPKLNKNKLSHSLVRQIKNGIKVLNRVTEGNKNENLEEFKERFAERYETQRIPLLLALDAETGVGYGQNSHSINSMTIFKELLINEVAKKTINLDISISPFIKSLMPKIHLVGRTGDLSIILKDNDVDQYQLTWASSPSTLAVMVEIFELDGTSKISLNYCGNNAAKLLARFGNGHPDIASLFKSIVEKECEDNEEDILAEIIHLPQERTGNILRRPNYRKYEIPYLASSSVAKDYQIPLQDLDIQIEKNSIILISSSRNKRVIPKLTNAHNYGNSNTPVYQFLCDLQNQNKRGFGFSWGPLRIFFDFLPRLEYQNLIISKAQWKISKEEIIEVLGEDLLVDSKKINRWRKTRNLPEQILVLEGDNKLGINITNLDSLEILIKIIDRKSSIWVEEFLLTPDNCLVAGNKGKYASEFIIPFYSN
ncbi:MAG: lantibiotic dehydratase family protein [Gammaproteobacteria bacterium]|nr:lantibiotic dehydratase family protein [Gammaproteobacteria bacterium]